MKLNAFAIADQGLLVGAPILGAGAMIWATATPGNPPIGLAIGWAAVAAWLAIGSWAAWKRYWRPQ